jgi:hypothetical protein
MKKTTPMLLTEFITGLNEAIGAAGVMMHHHQDLRWNFVRQILEETKDRTVKFAVNPMTAPKTKKYEKKTQILLP